MDKLGAELGLDDGTRDNVGLVVGVSVLKHSMTKDQAFIHSNLASGSSFSIAGRKSGWLQ